MKNDILKHYGIPGMHWGQRKSRSSSGRSSSDHTRARKLQGKKLSEMSNDELAALNKRLQLERNYKDLTAKQTTDGRKVANNVIADIGKAAALSSAVITLAANGAKIFKFVKTNLQK